MKNYVRATQCLCKNNYYSLVFYMYKFLKKTLPIFKSSHYWYSPRELWWVISIPRRQTSRSHWDLTAARQHQRFSDELDVITVFLQLENLQQFYHFFLCQQDKVIPLLNSKEANDFNLYAGLCCPICHCRANLTHCNLNTLMFLDKGNLNHAMFSTWSVNLYAIYYFILQQ